MNTGVKKKKLAARVAEDRGHHKELIRANIRAKDAITSLFDDDVLTHAQAAIERIEGTHPGEAQTLRKAFLDLWEGMQEACEALADAQYHECERRALAPELQRAKTATKRVQQRWANDPKRAAKAGALQLWLERNDGKHPKLRTVAQYATEVMRRWPVLTSARVIEDWSAQWTKAARSGETPAC